MQESEEQLQASGKPPPHGLNRVLAATLSSTAPNRLLLGERLAAEVSATSSVQMARHSLTSATYTQLRLSSPITRIVTVRGGRQPRTHKQPCPVLSIALDPPSFKLRLAFCEKLPKHLSPSFRCWEGTLPTRFGVGSSGDMIFALASVNVLLSYSSALPEAGSEPAFNSSAWTSPCSTLISVGSVRELPEPTKVELSLYLSPRWCLFAVAYLVHCIHVRGVDVTVQRPLTLKRRSNLSKYIQPLRRCKTTSRNSVSNR